jgi:hypothetical protein
MRAQQNAQKGPVLADEETRLRARARASAHLVCAGVGRQAVIKEIRQDLLELLAFLDFAPDKVDGLLARHDVPDAIAS